MHQRTDTRVCIFSGPDLLYQCCLFSPHFSLMNCYVNHFNSGGYTYTISMELSVLNPNGLLVKFL